MSRRLSLNVARWLALAGILVAALALMWQCWEIAVVESSPDAQSPQNRTVDWYYWLNTGSRTIQRGRLDGSGVVETVVSRTEMSRGTDFVVDGGYVYWSDSGFRHILRKSADGTGTVQQLATTDITAPNRIAVNGGYVYWSDTSLQTIKRVSTSGGTVVSIAGRDDGVNAPVALAADATYVYWADNGSDSIRRALVASPFTTTELANSDHVTTPVDLELGVGSAFVYWTDSGDAAIRSVSTSGSFTVTDLVTNTNDTPVSTLGVMALDSGNQYIYWVDTRARAVRRVAADGRAGTFETIADSAGTAFGDLVLSPDNGAAYWLDNSAVRIKRTAADGSSGITTLAVTTLSTPTRLRVAQTSETVAAACITDAGSHSADYATFEWDASISAGCPFAFFTIRLSEDTDLRVEASSSAIDPVPLLRRGGVGGSIIAVGAASSGASTPYVHSVEDGEYTLELVRGTNSSQQSGEFNVMLDVQPALVGCDANVGNLSSDQLQVFGGYDKECGDTRDYFFYLEFQANVSASLSGNGFRPTIELRPGSASDSSTAIAQKTGNPADFYQQVTSGSYRVTIKNLDADSTYILTLQAFGLPPPTRTPIPTPTPRFQPNVDVRLEPDPRGVNYKPNTVYVFRVEGGSSSFPALVRSSDPTNVRITTGANRALDCLAGSEATIPAPLGMVFVHICAAGLNATIEIIKQSDYSLLGRYGIFVSGGPVQQPGAVGGPPGYQPPGRDHLGIEVVAGALCSALNISCNTGLIKNGIGLFGSLVMFAAPTGVARGRPSGFSIGIGLVLFIVGLLLANQLIGMPLWWGGIGIIALFGIAAVGIFVKLRRLRA